MIVIELFGLPGAGKTTYANKLSNSKWFHDKKFIKFNGNNWGENKNTKLMHKINVVFHSLKYKYLIFFIEVLIFQLRIGILSIESFIRTTSLLLYFGQLELLLKMNDNSKIYITDNGIFQTFVSIMYNEKLNYNDVCKILKFINNFQKLSILRNVSFIYKTCTVDECFLRIKNRNKNIRIKYLEKNVQYEILSYQLRMFETFSKCSNLKVLKV